MSVVSTLSHVHKTKKAKKEAFQAHFKQEESKESKEQGLCETGEHLRTTYKIATTLLVGHSPHAHTFF